MSRRRHVRPALLALVAVAVAGCGQLGRGGADDGRPTRTVATTPPAGASQPPGPPLATAPAPPPRRLVPTDPVSVAAVCYRLWQSFDSRRDDPQAGLRRARSCLTEDLFGALGGVAPRAPGRAWLELRAKGTRSTVAVLAVAPLGGADTGASGRAVLLLNMRRTTTTDAGAPTTDVETPALTLLRQPDRTWRVSAVDRATGYGDAPGA